MVCSYSNEIVYRISVGDLFVMGVLVPTTGFSRWRACPQRPITPSYEISLDSCMGHGAGVATV